MRLDGYAFSEYFRSLTLLVSKYQAKAIPDKIKKTELDKLMRKAVKFYKTCQTNYFEELEESSDGYQAYEFIKAHRADIETVNIIFLTNDEVVQFVPEDISYGKISIKFDVWDIERLYQSIFSGTAVERQLKQYQQVGNAVPPIMAKSIAEKLAQILEKNLAGRERNG